MDRSAECQIHGTSSDGDSAPSLASRQPAQRANRDRPSLIVDLLLRIPFGLRIKVGYRAPQDRTIAAHADSFDPTPEGASDWNRPSESSSAGGVKKILPPAVGRERGRLPNQFVCQKSQTVAPVQRAGTPTGLLPSDPNALEKGPKESGGRLLARRQKATAVAHHTQGDGISLRPAFL